MTSYKEIFSEIYKKNYWGGKGSPSSGTGSTATAAMTYRNTVKELISRKNVKKVLDLGHGDWEIWSDYQFEGVEYLGIDLANSLSEGLAKKFKQENLTFRFGDAITDDLPIADLCITKDVLQHLPLGDVIKILAKIQRFENVIICNDFYKFRFQDSLKSLRRFVSIRERLNLLINGKSTFFLKLKKTNSEINPGEHRCINLSRYPFDIYLSNFEIQTIDFIGKDKRRPNIVKRIYILEKKSQQGSTKKQE